MQGARGHVEGGGHQDQLGPQVPHDPEKLGKADIKADGQPQFSQRCVYHRDLAAGGEGVRLHKPLAPRHINVKEVNLAVAGQLLPLGREEVTGVVNGLPLDLRYRPSRQVNPQLPGHAGKKLPGLSSGGLPVDRKAGILIGTVEHLRQQGQIGALGGGLTEAALRPAEVLLFVRCHTHLAQSQSDSHRQAPFLLPGPAGDRRGTTGVLP